MKELYYLIISVAIVIGAIYLINKNTQQTISQTTTQTKPQSTQIVENPNNIIPLVSYPDLVLEHPIYYDRYRYDYDFPYFRHYHHDHNRRHHHNYVPDHRMPAKPILKPISKPVPKPVPKK
jgi:hypothetical protein